MEKSKQTRISNAPSKTGGKSGKGRENNTPRPGKTPPPSPKKG